MAETVTHVQARHVRRCVIVANGNMETLVIAALNAQAAGRGDYIKKWVIGSAVWSSSASFTVANPDGTGAITVAAPYACPAVENMADTLLGGGANLGVEVYYTGNEKIP